MSLMEVVLPPDGRDNMAKHYFECHITIEPLPMATIILLRKPVAYYHFRIADLYMAKREGDTEQRPKYDTFMTARDRNYIALRYNMTQCIRYLEREAGIKVWRYKIEDTICDSKLEDIYNLISNKEP